MKYTLFFLGLLSLLACEKPQPQTQDFQIGPGYLVCNEGNFTFGNAALSFISEDFTETKNQVFTTSNGIPIGDVLQSSLIFNNELYLVVNNSGKIWVCDPNTLKIKRVIEGLNSPRYLIPLNQNELLISDLYAPYILVYNSETNSISDSLMLGRSTETFLGFNAFVLSHSWAGDSAIHKIPRNTALPTEMTIVGPQPISMTKGPDSLVHILCQGKTDGSNRIAGSLFSLDPNTMGIIDIFEFLNPQASPSQIVFNSADGFYYLLSNTNPFNSSLPGGLFRFTDPATASQEPFISNAGKLFYHLYLDTEEQLIFLSDAKDYLQSGDLLVFDITDGNPRLIHTKNCSVIPSFITKKPD
ncbi:MAG: YncE family protein [Luteibaculum sp.]